MLELITILFPDELEEPAPTSAGVIVTSVPVIVPASILAALIVLAAI